MNNVTLENVQIAMRSRACWEALEALAFALSSVAEATTAVAEAFRVVGEGSAVGVQINNPTLEDDDDDEEDDDD